MQYSHSHDYGFIKAGTGFEFPEEGYCTLVGLNNSGKSTVLQFVLKKYIEAGNPAQSIAYVQPERSFIQPSTETNSRSLSEWNMEQYRTLDTQPQGHAAPNGPGGHELMRLLVNNTEFLGQTDKLQSFLSNLGFGKFRLVASQNIVFGSGPVEVQGTGLRSLLSILAALTDEAIKIVLIDEPELYLEPTIQKALRDLLIEQADGKLIIAATHSHLFLNRQDPTMNYRIERNVDEEIEATGLESEDDLYDLTFRLLGNDTSDLFFPGNYVVVEGASEVVICNRLRELMNIDQARLKFISAGGLERVKNKVVAFEDSLHPLVMPDSPYKERVVALIDKPGSGQSKVEGAIASVLGPEGARLFTISASSLEELLPDELYTRAALSKAEELAKIVKAGTDHVELSEIKASISNKIADALVSTDLKMAELSTLVEAIQKANEF